MHLHSSSFCLFQCVARGRASSWVGLGPDSLITHQPRVYQTTSFIDVAFQTLQSQVLAQDITRKTLRFFIRHCPHLSTYHYIHTVRMTKSPRPSPPFLHTVSDQKLDDGKAWEWGYPLLCFFSGPLHMYGTPNATKWLLNCCHMSELQESRSEVFAAFFFFAVQGCLLSKVSLIATQSRLCKLRTVHCSSHTMHNVSKMMQCLWAWVLHEMCVSHMQCVRVESPACVHHPVYLHLRSV